MISIKLFCKLNYHCSCFLKLGVWEYLMWIITGKISRLMTEDFNSNPLVINSRKLMLHQNLYLIYNHYKLWWNNNYKENNSLIFAVGISSPRMDQIALIERYMIIFLHKFPFLTLFKYLKWIFAKHRWWNLLFFYSFSLYNEATLRYHPWVTVFEELKHLYAGNIRII